VGGGIWNEEAKCAQVSLCYWDHSLILDCFPQNKVKVDVCKGKQKVMKLCPCSVEIIWTETRKNLCRIMQRLILRLLVRKHGILKLLQCVRIKIALSAACFTSSLQEAWTGRYFWLGIPDFYLCKIKIMIFGMWHHVFYTHQYMMSHFMRPYLDTVMRILTVTCKICLNLVQAINARQKWSALKIKYYLMIWCLFQNQDIMKLSDTSHSRIYYNLVNKFYINKISWFLSIPVNYVSIYMCLVQHVWVLFTYILAYLHTGTFIHSYNLLWSHCFKHDSNMCMCICIYIHICWTVAYLSLIWCFGTTLQYRLHVSVQYLYYVTYNTIMM
jgi:hypothetical protein